MCRCFLLNCGHADVLCRLRDVTEPNRQELADVIDAVAKQALLYLEDLDERLVREPGSDAALEAFRADLPEDGVGGLQTLHQLMAQGIDAATHSSGPRFFHFVIGGVTPAALGADWLTALLDQNPGLWLGSPLGARLASVVVGWLQDLFDIPRSWGGVLTTGATMANYVGLAAARHWWADRHGVDVERQGLASLPSAPIFSSGYLHASAVKAIGMLGLGHDSVKLLRRDDAGRIDLDALERALDDLGGAPAIVIANAGEVNTGDFDPIEKIADLTHRYDAWLHVDGAFGLFAALSPRTKHLVAGIERADSVISDAHKWMNVPYESGFAFVRDRELLPKVFRMGAAAYLTRSTEDRPDFGFMTPESSQRARALPLWATLNAYGRAGYRAMVERHLDFAQRVAGRVDAADDLERLAEVPLNIVCFRYRPPQVPEAELDDLNARLGKAVLEDGRVYVGTTTYRGRTCFRPAIVNWRTRESDVDLMVDVIRELGGRLAA